MISFSPIWAIALRHLRLYKHDLNLLLMVLYWPILDIVTWGFFGSWIQGSGITQFHNYTTTTLLSVLLWQIAARGANIIALAFNEELWQNNIINLFSLPLKLLEWSLGTIIYFAIMIGITALFGFSLIRSIKVSSEITLTPSFSAFSFFDGPIFSPATR